MVKQLSWWPQRSIGTVCSWKRYRNDLLLIKWIDSKLSCIFLYVHSYGVGGRGYELCCCPVVPNSRGSKMGSKMNIVSEKIRFSAHNIFSIFEWTTKEIQYIILIFLKFIISIKSRHCDYWPYVPKNTSYTSVHWWYQQEQYFWCKIIKMAVLLLCLGYDLLAEVQLSLANLFTLVYAHCRIQYRILLSHFIHFHITCLVGSSLIYPKHNFNIHHCMMKCRRSYTTVKLSQNLVVPLVWTSQKKCDRRRCEVVWSISPVFTVVQNFHEQWTMVKKVCVT